MKIDEKAKKMLISFGIGIGAIILIVIIVLIVGMIKNSSLSYAGIESKLVSGARKYYANKKDALPLNDNDEVEVDASLLKEEGYIKDLSKYQKDKNVACSGKVIVTKSGNYYNYSPYLNCGDKYTTTYLYEELISKVVSKDDGLYKKEQYSTKTKGKETVYVFRGDYVNNFIKLDEFLWRIVKINSDYSLEIIQENDKKTRLSSVWDNRYNNTKNENAGINDYYKSIIRKNISDYYNSSTLSDTAKEKIVFKDICVGSRKLSETKNDGSVECRNIMQNEPISLLPVYDFINASLDTNCKRFDNYNCSNYNYLSKYERGFWLLTTSSEKSYIGYGIYNNFTASKLSSVKVARLVTNLNKNIIFAGGSGTESDPYLIK